MIGEVHKRYVVRKVGQVRRVTVDTWHPDEVSTEARCGVNAGALEGLPPAEDDAAVLQLRQTAESDCGIRVAPSDLVVGHDTEADQIAQRSDVARGEIAK